MNSKVFSKDVLSRVRQSGFEYARKSYETKQTVTALLHRVKILIGYKPNEEKLDNLCELEVILSLINSSLLQHRKKVQDKSSCYNYTRHIQLNKLLNEIKEKRDKLITYRA